MHFKFSSAAQDVRRQLPALQNDRNLVPIESVFVLHVVLKATARWRVTDLAVLVQ